MSYGQRQRNVTENVKAILELYPETRNNPRKLLLCYWEEIDNIDFNGDWKDYFSTSSTSAESITRARRSVVASDPSLLTEDEHQARIDLEQQARDYHRGQA
jgi:hypothetical protein